MSSAKEEAASLPRRARLPAAVPRELPEAYVYPGQILCAPQPVVASTILGTCVAVCLFDTSTGIGGLNHFMLPTSSSAGVPSPRFGDVATRMLVEQLEVLGVRRVRMQAKVFGGMSARLEAEGLAKDLGARNIAAAIDALSELGIPVVAQDVGKPKSRKLVFHTADGRAWVRHF